MATFSRYVCDVLEQIISSYDMLAGLGDKPGDLKVLRREWVKAHALIASIAKRVGETPEAETIYGDLARRCQRYATDYDFNREMDTISSLYGEDPNRIRNIRLKILESLDERRFMENIRESATRLGGEHG